VEYRLSTHLLALLTEAGCSCANPYVEVDSDGNGVWVLVLIHPEADCPVAIGSARIAAAPYN
jgi:hypothetical protein